MKKTTTYRIKWQHLLIIFALLLATLPALIIGLNLISKTEQEIKQSINLQLTNIANNVSNEINFFFVDQLEKQFLIKKSLENNNLGTDEKLALIVSAVSSIEELISIALLFEEDPKLTVAFQSEKDLTDSSFSNNISELQKLIQNQVNVASDLINDQMKFGNPIYLESLNKWFIYTLISVEIENAPKAYLVSLIDLSPLEVNLAKPKYNELGSIIITNINNESIFNSIDSYTNENIVSDAIDMLKGDARVTQVSNYTQDDEKFVFSAAFTENIKWVVIAIENYDRAYSLVTDMSKTMSIWIVLGIGLALLFGIFATQRIREPINNLVEKANELSKGNFDISVDYDLDDSIGTLGSTMQSMGQSLKSSFLKIEKQNRELEDYNKSLENKVFERTQKLNETNKDLQRAYSQVLELNNEKSEFLGIAAHDLKNPLQVIRGYGEIIRDENALSKEELDDFAKSIVHSSERMFGIITSLLDVNKIEEGEINIKYEIISANEVVENVLAQNIDSAKNKSIEISFIPNKRSSDFNSDRAIVSQILDNILSNAIKFSPIGKSISMTVLSNDESVSFEIQDNGPGFTEKDKVHLFKKFARLSARPTGGEHSTGLGLSISKKLTELLGGDIKVESEFGKGAKFIIKLPK